MDFIFYLTLLCLILFFGAKYIDIDYDFWARLIVGKTYFQTGTLLNNDFYSYGSTHEFIDHEWGSSLIFYLIQNNFNDIGIFLFKSIIIFLTFYLITKIIRLENNKISLNILFFYFIIQTISNSIFTNIRCQIFSFFFFVLYIYIFKYVKQTKKYRILWCFPILNIIWANLHGGFIIGLILILIFSIGEFLNKNNKFLLFFYVFLLSCLSTLINPFGIKYIAYIFSAFTLKRVYIPEWQSIFSNNPYMFTMTKFYILLFSTFILFLFSILKNIKKYSFIEFYKKIDKTKYLIIIFTMLITFKSLRCHVFFVYAILIFCYTDFYEIFNKRLPKTIDNIKSYLIFVMIFVGTCYQVYNYKFINTIPSSKYPIFCCEFIKINNLKGNVFSIFHTGSYVAYKLYPNNYIFMDGRYEEVYDNNLINEMAKFFLAENKNIIKKYHTDLYIIDKTYPIYKIFKEDKTYFSPIEDKYFALFIDKKYKNRNFNYPTKKQNYYNLNKFKTNINWS